MSTDPWPSLPHNRQNGCSMPNSLLTYLLLHSISWPSINFQLSFAKIMVYFVQWLLAICMSVSGIDGTEDEIVMYRMCLPGHECSAHAWPMFMLPW